MTTTTIAILGSGNIGTDLLTKALRHPGLDVAAVAGIDATSDGLARARSLSVATTANGVHGLLDLPEFADVEIVLDATSAKAHHANADALAETRARIVDLTPAARGPFVVPPVNLHEHLDSPDVNMVTCGGQATVPIVHAVARTTPVHYAEIVASISSRSAGPGTRANVDEFTVTTARALEVVGGARHGKAIIVINPAEPPVLMRDTVHCLVDEPDREAVRASIHEMVDAVATYVPGYRLKQDVQFTPLAGDEPLDSIEPGLTARDRWQISVYLEVEGAADYLPAYAGNLDIMTAAAVQVAVELGHTPTRALNGATR